MGCRLSSLAITVLFSCVKSERVEVVEVSDANDVQLLQLALQLPQTPLRFMHIPKTGGTSIDAAGMHETTPAFDSLMRQTYERISAKLNYDGDLEDLYVKSHESWPTYAAFLAAFRDQYHLLPPNATYQCEDLHTPPSRSQFIRDYYSSGLTFCALRDPLERFWSLYRMQNRARCEPQAIEDATIDLLKEAKEKPYMDNCFLVPQVEFVYGTRNWTSASRQYCQRFLHQENLTAEFDELMKEIGRPEVKLPEEELMADWSTCRNLTTKELTPKTRMAVYDFFKVDYEAFGYHPPDA